MRVAERTVGGNLDRTGWFLLAALLLSALSLLSGVPARPSMIEPDEGRYADISASMARTGDFVTPRLDGLRYFEKPPLLYWAGAASIAALGRTESAARLPTKLAAIATAVATFALVRILGGGPGAGWMAAALFSGSLLGGVLSNVISIDMLLTLGITGSLAFLALAARRSEEGGGLSRLEGGALGLALAVGVLAKGPVGAALPLGAAFFWWLARGRTLRSFLAFRPLEAAVIGLSVSAPWFVLVSLRNPRFAEFFFIGEHLRRFATDEAHRDQPPGVLILELLVGILPWTVAGVIATARSLRPAERKGAAFLVVLGALLPLVLFSVSRSQLPSYVLPSIPPLAALAAVAIERDFGVLRRASILPSILGAVLLAAALLPLPVPERAVPMVLPFGVLGAFLLATGLAGRYFPVRAATMAFAAIPLLLIPALAPATTGALRGKSTGEWSAEAAAAIGDARVVAYKGMVMSLPFHLGRPIPVCRWHNELRHGLSYEDANDLEWTPEQLAEEWSGARRVVAVLADRHLDEFLSEKLEPRFVHRRLAGRFLLISNQPWPDPSGGGAP